MCLDATCHPEAGYCVWMWDGSRWIEIQRHCKDGCGCCDPNKGPLDIRGRRPAQMYSFGCCPVKATQSHTRQHNGLECGYTVCQYFSDTGWLQIQDNCINGCTANCGSYYGKPYDNPVDGQIS